MGIVYTDEQEQLLKDVYDWYKNSSELVLQISGKAGTGKSFMMHQIQNMLKLEDRLYIGEENIYDAMEKDINY